jgi:hypothetical protein
MASADAIVTGFAVTRYARRATRCTLERSATVRGFALPGKCNGVAAKQGGRRSYSYFARRIGFGCPETIPAQVKSRPVDRHGRKHSPGRRRLAPVRVPSVKAFGRSLRLEALHGCPIHRLLRRGEVDDGCEALIGFVCPHRDALEFLLSFFHARMRVWLA